MSDYNSKELKRILDSLNTPLSALKVLKRPVDTWDDMLVFHGVSLLNDDAKMHFEEFLNNINLRLSTIDPAPSISSSPSGQGPDETAIKRDSEPAKFSSFIQFLENQINMLELIENYHTGSGPIIFTNSAKYKNSNVSTQSAKVFHVQSDQKPNTNKNECIICKNNHHFAHCSNFKSKSIPQRIEFVKAAKRCYNCLGNHFSSKCTSEKRCTVCNKKHNTSLHIVNYKKPQNKPQNSQVNTSTHVQYSNDSVQQSCSTESHGTSNS